MVCDSSEPRGFARSQQDSDKKPADPRGNPIIAHDRLPVRYRLLPVVLPYPLHISNRHSNPVYSCRREKLLQYVPDTCTFTCGSYTLSDSFRASISASPAAQDPSSPESEFLHNLTLSPAELGARIVAYMNKITERLRSSAGVDDYMLLAESRRRIFRPYPSSRGKTTNPLSEFTKTLPYATLIPQEWKHLEMTEDAEVRVMGDEGQCS